MLVIKAIISQSIHMVKTWYIDLLTDIDLKYGVTGISSADFIIILNKRAQRDFLKKIPKKFVVEWITYKLVTYY